MPTPPSDPAVRLVQPGERLGWIYHDPASFWRTFDQQWPDRLYGYPQKRYGLVAAGVFGGTVVLTGLVACCGVVTSEAPVGRVIQALAGVVALVGTVLGTSLLIAARRENSARDLELRSRQAAWHTSKAEFEHRQRDAVERRPVWEAVAPSPAYHRLDIIGGTPRSWEAVLTIHGSSLAGTRPPVTVVDFTGLGMGGPLLHVLGLSGRPACAVRFPSQLDQLDVAAGLTPADLVDCLVEAMHGDAQGSTRGERSEDALLLHEICEGLRTEVTIARINAALRFLTDRSGPVLLSSAESERLTDMFPDEVRRQAHARIRRVEASLRPLNVLGSAVHAAGADEPVLTCLIADRDGHSARSELLKDLLVQLITRQVGRAGSRLGALVLIGADEIGHRHLERLTDLCEQARVRLVLFSAHLRTEALQAIGGGQVAFMRLGNHLEAAQAAEFVGREYRFAMSSYTSSTGGDRSRSVSETHGALFRLEEWSFTQQHSEGVNWSQSETAQRVHEFTVEPTALQSLPEFAMLLVRNAGRPGATLEAVECNPAIAAHPKTQMVPAGTAAARATHR